MFRACGENTDVTMNMDTVMECFSDIYFSVLLYPRFGKPKKVRLYQVFGGHSEEWIQSRC